MADFRAEARLDANPAGFKKGVSEAGASFKGLQADVGKASGAISTALQFAAGFGIITALQQAGAAFEGFLETIRRQGDRLAAQAGAQPGGTAASLFRKAGEQRAEAVRAPFAAGAAGLKAGVLQLIQFLPLFQVATRLAGETGAEIRKGLDEMILEAAKTARELANAGTGLRSVSDASLLLAENAAAFEQKQRQSILPQLVQQARGVGVSQEQIQGIVRAIDALVGDRLAQLQQAIQASAQTGATAP